MKRIAAWTVGFLAMIAAITAAARGNAAGYWSAATAAMVALAWLDFDRRVSR